MGVIGLVNLAAGLLLLRRNHLVGWLTITPLFALSLPFVANGLGLAEYEAIEAFKRYSPEGFLQHGQL